MPLRLLSGSVSVRYKTLFTLPLQSNFSLQLVLFWLLFRCLPGNFLSPQRPLPRPVAEQEH